MVSAEVVDNIAQLHITPDHPVFEIVPPALSMLIGACYDTLGHPAMSRDSAWDVYCNLLAVVQHHDATPLLLVSVPKTTPADDSDELALLPNLQDLPFHETETGYYMGGVGGGMGLCTY